MRRLAAALLLAAFAFQTYGQARTAKPEPWNKDEFPLWAQDSLRFVVVSVGSYPFTLFIMNETADFQRYFGNDFDSRYIPWPLKNEYSYQPSQDEIKTALIGAGIGAVFVGIVDFVINRIILNGGQ